MPRHALILSLMLASLAPPAWAAPGITITQVPRWNVSEQLKGQVTGVANPDSTAYVATYLHVDGNWWIKPNDNPLARTPIAADGAWAATVVTGGNDALADEYYVAVMPNSFGDPPSALGVADIPTSVAANALATFLVTRVEQYNRMINFAGYVWGVKQSTGQVGPGPNYFSDLPSDVWVDAAGLHLTVHNHDSHWWSTEVVLQGSLGYGTYSFQTASRVDTLDPNITFGLFTWDNFGDWTAQPSWPYREIDFEYGRWNNAGDPTNAQMVNQPYYTAGNLHRYRIDLTDAAPELTSWFDWQPTYIRWTSAKGYQSPFSVDPANVIDQLTYANNPGQSHLVPDEGRENFRFNLWQVNSGPPTNGQPAEMLITDFKFSKQSTTAIGPRPYGGTAATIPGKVQAENFDLGGYSDTDATNNGGAYRTTEGVDIEACSDTGGGYDVGWNESGEWADYTTTVTQHGIYHFDARVASQPGGGQFRLWVDPSTSNTVVGTVSVETTGGWQNWTTLPVGDVELTQGFHTLRLEAVANNYNVNYIDGSLTLAIPVRLSALAVE